MSAVAHAILFLVHDILAITSTWKMPLQDRVLTASERIYRELRKAATEEERANLEGQLVAICIAACRRKHVAPPYERDRESEYIYGRPRWVGGPFSLPSWVRDWVSGQVFVKARKDGARYIGRRCVNALIDEIRSHERRKRGAQERSRVRRYGGEMQWPLNKVRRALTKLGLPGKLPIAGDRKLFRRLMAGYPNKLSNAAVARALGVTEGAIRKRRKRISRVCFTLTADNYILNVVFRGLGLKR